MNSIDRINKINQQELDDNVQDSASWHMDYKDSSYIYIGGLNPKLLDKDILIIFSQYGLPTHIKLLKDTDETGNTVNKGFGYLKYDDFKSCVLAVDNLNGVVLYDKKIRVDHCWFQLKESESEDDYRVDYDKLVPKTKEIEYKREVSKYSSKEKKETITEQDDEFKDPLQDMTKHKANDEVDDEFRDPMADFVKKRHSSSRHGHRSKRHKHKTEEPVEGNDTNNEN